MGFVRKILFSLLFITGVATLFSQTTDPYDTTGATFVGDDTKTPDENLKSIRDDREEVLLYGIESEVIEVIGLIQKENDDSYNSELLMILSETENTTLGERIYQILAGFEDKRAEDLAIADIAPILDDFRFQERRILAAITYLGDVKSEKAVDILYDLAKKDEPSLTGRVVYNIGKIGNLSRAEELEELYEEYQGDDTKDVAINIIFAWGEMKHHGVVDLLLDIIDDTSATSTEREYSAVALGKIGDPKALDPLIRLYTEESKDSMIRAFAISGIMYFDDSQVEDLLLQALKRDSYWKIRVTACEGLGKMKSSNAVEILDFKLRRDTENNVRVAAAKALGEINNSQAGDILVEYFVSEENSFSLRQEVLKVLLKQQVSGTMDALNEVFQKHWEKKDTQLNFLKSLCKELSVTEWSALSSLYRRMLTHSDNYIQIYGIRGIAINNMITLYGDVRDLDADGVNGLVRREAKSLE